MKLKTLKTNVNTMVEIDVNTIANQLVSAQLKKNNYQLVFVSGKYLVADSPMRKIIVLVKAARSPKKPVSISAAEKDELKVEADKLQREAWTANLMIKDNALEGFIEWFNLSR